LPYEDSKFDRVVVTCLLVHLENPEKCLLELRRVCKPGGVITIYLPCEPGLFLRLVRKFTTELKTQRVSQLDPKLIHFLEHRTSHESIVYFSKKIFGDKKMSKDYWPFKLISWNLNLFAIFQVSVDELNKEYPLR
jgi:ubiquinone/menaquinone biosynthesis C-methylase UbiE